MRNGKQQDHNLPTQVGPQENGHSDSSPLPATAIVTHPGYEIRIKDHLDTYWQEWFAGWHITNLECGEVLLRRFNVDRSALHGALNKIRDLNLLLLSVVQVTQEVSK